MGALASAGGWMAFLLIDSGSRAGQRQPPLLRSWLNDCARWKTVMLAQWKPVDGKERSRQNVRSKRATIRGRPAGPRKTRPKALENHQAK